MQVALIREARRRGSFCDPCPRANEATRKFNPALHGVGVGRKARQTQETAYRLKTADARERGQMLEAVGCRRIVVDKFARQRQSSRYSRRGFHRIAEESAKQQGETLVGTRRVAVLALHSRVRLRETTPSAGLAHDWRRKFFRGCRSVADIGHD